MSARLTPLLPSVMPPKAWRLYRSLVATRAQLAEVAAVVGPDGELLGPFDALLRSPAIGDAVQRVGTALRQESTGWSRPVVGLAASAMHHVLLHGAQQVLDIAGLRRGSEASEA